LSDEIRYPSLRQVERLYDQIIAMTGGEHGYISKSNLEYLLDTVKDIGERLDRRQALTKKAAYLLYNIIVLHPFVNGNKRTGYDLVRLFLRLNGHGIRASQKDTYRFLIEVASGNISARKVDEWVAINLTEMSAE
jgi:death-on-curing protein